MSTSTTWNPFVLKLSTTKYLTVLELCSALMNGINVKTFLSTSNYSNCDWLYVNWLRQLEDLSLSQGKSPDNYWLSSTECERMKLCLAVVAAAPEISYYIFQRRQVNRIEPFNLEEFSENINCFASNWN